MVILSDKNTEINNFIEMKYVMGEHKEGKEKQQIHAKMHHVSTGVIHKSDMSAQKIRHDVK